MLYFARWKIIAILLVVLASFIVVLPNFFSKETVDGWPAWMPRSPTSGTGGPGWGPWPWRAWTAPSRTSGP